MTKSGLSAVFAITFCAIVGAEWPRQAQSDTGDDNVPPICNPGGPYLGAPGSLIDFDGTQSRDPDGNILIYRWDFGDGTSAIGPTLSHAFSVEAVHRVTLTTIDDQRDSTSCSSEATIALRSLSTIDMTSPEDLLDSHRIVFQGIVISSIPNLKRYHTDLEIWVQEYFAGTGPTTARVRVKAVDTDSIKTIVSHGSPFSLPRIGDSAVFWIFHHQETAIIRGSRAIRIIRGDSLSVAQARLRIKAAVESLGWPRQFASASHVVIARSKETFPRPCEEDDYAYYCHTIHVDRQLLGPLISDTSLTFRTPARYQKLESVFWRARTGLLFVRAETGVKAYQPTHPTFGFLAQIGDRFVVGYKLVRTASLSKIEPVTLPLSEILR